MYRQVVQLTTCYLLLGSIKGENNNNDKAVNDTTKPKRQVLTGSPLEFFIYPGTNEGNSFFKPIEVAEPSQINQLTASTDIIYQHSNGHLQDSYGNRFQDSPYTSQVQQQKLTQQPTSAAPHQQFSFQTDQPQQGIFLQNTQLPFSQTFQKQLQAQNYQASNTFSVPHRDLGAIPVDFGQIPQEKNKAVFSQPLTENIRAPQGTPSYQQLQQHFTNNLNGFNTPQFAHSAIPARLQALSQSKQPPTQQIQKPTHPATLSQIKAINPQFLKPQVFANPIVPQHQHFLPPIRYFLPKVQQITADVATTVAPLPPPPPPSATPQTHAPQAEEKPRTANDGSKRDNMKHHVREEVKGVIIREEEGGEDDFEDGYRESARGFPAYKRGQKDESDDDRSEAQDEDDDESSEPHQSNSYPREQDDDDDDSNSYSPQYSDDQSRRNNYYRERGHTRHSSDERDPRKSSYRSSYKIKSKPKSYYSQKYSSDDSSKPKYSSYKQYSDDEDRPKYYNSRPDSHYRKGNNRYEKYRSYSDAEDSYHDNSAPAVTKSKFVAPKSEYGGFEPIPHSSDSSSADSRTKLTSVAPNDAKAAASRPGTKRKLYKENWFISKTKTA